MSPFKPKFADYDVVVANYTGADWSEETNRSLTEYMTGGGGLVIFHAACNAFPEWKEWNQMTGVGGWGGRNEKSGPMLYWEDGKIVRDTSTGPGGTHGPQHAFQLIVREPDHPITKGLPEKFTHNPDELYSKLRGPAENLTVLATAYADPSKRGTGKHEPILMVIQFGKGRVFHTALGHAESQLKSVGFITTFVRGTEWAATGRVTIPVPDDFPGADEPSVRE
jgi:type 1 glutamine amidotransferase